MAVGPGKGTAPRDNPRPRQSAARGWLSAGWLTETVDTGGGKTSSLALDPDPPHPPRVSYTNETHTSLKYAWRSGTTWLSITVDNGTADVGLFTSLALDAPGRPRISYFDETNGDLRYAWLGGGHRVRLPLVVQGAR